MNLKEGSKKFLSVLIIISLVLTLNFLFFGVKRVSADDDEYVTIINNPEGNEGGWNFGSWAYKDNYFRAFVYRTKTHKYYNYRFSLDGRIIESVKVGVKGCVACISGLGNDDVKVSVSWDGGFNWSEWQTVDLKAGCWNETLTWLDFSGATSWTPDKLKDSNFRVKIKHKKEGNWLETVYLNWIPVKVTYSPSADLEIEKSGPSEIIAGNELTYTITVTNNGPDTAQGVELTDTLPSEIENATFECSTDGTNYTSGGNWTGSYTLSNPLPPNSSFYIKITGTVDPSTSDNTTLSNAATVTSTTKRTDGSDNNISDEVDTTVKTEADLLSTKIDDTDPVVAGEILTYTITVKNNGKSDAWGVTLTDNMPTEILNPEYSLDNGSTWTSFSGNLTLSLGTMTPNSSKVILIRGTVDPSTSNNSTITNTASVSSNTDDPDTDNNSDKEETTVTTQADLSVTKTILNPTTYIEDDITYHIVVTNNGPSYAQNVEVTDLLPSGLVYKSCVVSQGTYNYNTGKWNIGTLANDSTVTLDITVRIEDYNPVTNTATVTSDTTDPIPGNNASSVTIDTEDPFIKGIAPRVGYFEFFIRRDTKRWLLRIPDKEYTTGWIRFAHFSERYGTLRGIYINTRTGISLDLHVDYRTGRYELNYIDRGAGIIIKIEGEYNN